MGGEWNGADGVFRSPLAAFGTGEIARMTNEEKFGLEGLTFDDVLLMPAYSEVLPTPRDISTVARLTRVRAVSGQAAG